MNLVKKEYLFQLIEQRSMPNVQVYGADNKSLIFETDDETQTASQAKTELMNFFDDMAQPGIYIVRVSKKNRKEKGAGGDTTTHSFRIQITDGSQTGKAIGGVPSEFTNDYKSLIDKNIELQTKIIRLEEEKKRKEEIDILQKQIDKLKEESPLEKYAPLIAGFFTKGGQAMNGQEQAHNLAAVAGPTDTKTENKQKIISAVNRLSKIDPNFADTITKLAAFAEAEPQKYLSFIPMLDTFI